MKRRLQGVGNAKHNPNTLNNAMKLRLMMVAAGLATLGASVQLHAQYTPPPFPAPFAGFINETLRKQNPEMEAWDFGGALRARYELKDGFAIPGRNGSMDLREEGAYTFNDYFLERFLYHAGYKANWWSLFVEGRSSLAQEDERFAYFANPLPTGTKNRDGLGPESDRVDLHQAYFTVGNEKE